MIKFAGWKADELHSRNEVTKLLCEYIAKNNLKNSENKRLINVDAPLKSLLRYDEARDGPLTYARIQKLLKPHFIPTV
jgi:chromatin remodeling complex protein RSC6